MEVALIHMSLRLLASLATDQVPSILWETSELAAMICFLVAQVLLGVVCYLDPITQVLVPEPMTHTHLAVPLDMEMVPRRGHLVLDLTRLGLLLLLMLPMSQIQIFYSRLELARLKGVVVE
jgi:hypothetical protein